MITESTTVADELAATYSAEGDAVWVVEKVLDQPTAAPSTP